MTDILQAARSGVTLVHMPTGVRASSLYDRSQFRNMRKAKSLLRSRLWAEANVKRSAEIVRSYSENEASQ